MGFLFERDCLPVPHGVVHEGMITKKSNYRQASDIVFNLAARKLKVDRPRSRHTAHIKMNFPFLMVCSCLYLSCGAKYKLSCL